MTLCFQDIERLQHYGQQYGADASYDTYDPNLINPAVFFSDDAEANTGNVSTIFRLRPKAKDSRNCCCSLLKRNRVE